MLMVTTTEGMFYWVHSNTTNLWPAVTFDLVLVVGTSGLQEGFVDTTTSSNNTHGSSTSAVKNFLGSGWKLDSGLSGVGVVRDNDGGVTGGLGELSSVTVFHFNATAGGTFWHLSDWENVSDVEGSFTATVDSLSSGGSFSGNKQFSVLSEFVRILELDLGEGSTSAWIVEDVLNDTFNETMSFSIVHGPVLCWAFTGSLDGLENTAGTFTTGSDDTSHL